jgi:hypothetical protein
MSPKRFWAILAVVVVGVTAAVGSVPYWRVSDLDRASIKLLLCIVACLLTINGGLILYTHWVIPPSKRVILRLLGFILTTGLALTFAPFGLSSIEEAKLEARFNGGPREDPKPPLDRGNNGQIKGELKMAKRNPSEDAMGFFVATVASGFLTVLLYLGVDGAQAIWARQSRR